MNGSNGSSEPSTEWILTAQKDEVWGPRQIWWVFDTFGETRLTREFLENGGWDVWIRRCGPVLTGTDLDVLRAV